MLANSGFGGWVLYDLTFLRGPLGEVEDLGQLVLGGGGRGEHSAGFGTPAGRREDHDGLLDLLEMVEELPDREVQAGLLGLPAHEVRDLQRQDTGEGVHADVVLGPVMHG